MRKSNIGNLAIIGIVLLNIVLWLAFPPASQLETPYWLQYSGELLASTAMILISIGLVLAAKPRFLESIFGGLDQMYSTHKSISMLAFLLSDSVPPARSPPDQVLVPVKMSLLSTSKAEEVI